AAPTCIRAGRWDEGKTDCGPLLMVKLPDPYAQGAGPQAGRRPFARIDASPIAEGEIAQGRAVGRGGAAMAAAIGAGGEAFSGALGRDPMGRAVTEAGANLRAAQRRARPQP